MELDRAALFKVDVWLVFAIEIVEGPLRVLGFLDAFEPLFVRS